MNGGGSSCLEDLIETEKVVMREKIANHVMLLIGKVVSRLLRLIQIEKEILNNGRRLNI